VDEPGRDRQNGYAVDVLPPPPLPIPVEVLHAWDDRRAGAWAAGDVAGLRALYTPGSPAGRADAAMLRAWRARDLRVEGLAVQLLAVRVLAESDGRLRLRVTDRVAGGTAIGPGVRTVLPVDRATTRVVVLRVVAGEWRVALVS
jgi:hypothetical protein